jgi:hypothetical protein
MAGPRPLVVSESMRSAIFVLAGLVATCGGRMQVAVAAPDAAASWARPSAESGTGAMPWRAYASNEALKSGSPATDGRSGGERPAGGDGFHGAISTAPRPVCGGSITPGHAQPCKGIDKLRLSNPQVRDVEGRPLVSGRSGRVEVLLANPTSEAFGYPCVGFAADNGGVSFGSDNPSWFLYAIVAGASVTFSTSVHFSSSIPPGTVVHFTAWADVLHAGCPNGTQLQWDVTVI